MGRWEPCADQGEGSGLHRLRVPRDVGREILELMGPGSREEHRARVRQPGAPSIRTEIDRTPLVASAALKVTRSGDAYRPSASESLSGLTEVEGAIVSIPKAVEWIVPSCPTTSGP